jgi:hypothetical protein
VIKCVRFAVHVPLTLPVTVKDPPAATVKVQALAELNVNAAIVTAVEILGWFV